MDFMSIGAQEILMILLVAILVVGPTRIVEVGRTIGRITRAIKKASIDFSSAVSKEMELEEKDKKTTPPPEKKD
jgi:Sec-independent protein translocase protein TatA